MYKLFGKRCFDLLVSLVAFVALFPFFVIITVMLSISNNGSPFFTQKRPGKNGRIFRVIKFRTMTNARDEKGQLLSDEERLTALGKWIRKTSLDEIPQLLNVISGDLSLVGPRPLLAEYLPLYNERQRRRHNVRPGITGWAQIHGRNRVPWPERFEYDVWYVDHLSFALDLKILLKTISKVFKAEGISSKGSATMEKFTGN